jgi:type I restriction enzyme M protein
MTSCLLITNNNKPLKRKDKVLFVQAVNEVRSDKTMSYLDPKHIERIHNAYLNFKDEDTFTAVVDNEEILKDKNIRLSVQLFVKEDKIEEEDFDVLLEDWEQSSVALKSSMDELFKTLANG